MHPLPYPQVDTRGVVLYDNMPVSASELRRLQGAWRMVVLEHHPSFQLDFIISDPSARKAMYNLPFEDLHAPVVGPAHPFQKDGLAAGMKNHFSGHVEVREMIEL